MHTLSAKELSMRFKDGEYTAVAIVEYFLNRIESYDKDIGAFITVLKERSLEQAKALDIKRASGSHLGILAGVPVALKDNMHIKGVISTCASKFLTNYKAVFSSTVAELLEQEDAILIGKTNLDEFAMGSSTEHSALQRTCNPWNLEKVPGGSSGGSAAAVAARLCPIALGSDTGGSIRQPASFCGIVGYKPTYGRVSRYGLVAFASSLDQIGPLTTCTEDIALTMEVIGKHCNRDSTSIDIPKQEYLSRYDGKLEGVKVGVPWHFLESLDGEVLSNFKSALEDMKKLGAHLVDIDLDILKYSIAVYYILATAEASTNLARFDGVRYGLRSKNAKTLRDVYTLSKEEGFGAEVKRRILLGTYVLSSGYQDAYYKKAQKARTRIIEDYKKAFSQCHVVAMPVTPTAAFSIEEVQDPLKMYFADMYTISANLAGIPAISIPSGFNSEGLPLGLQLQARQLHDVELCRIANAYEASTQHNSMMPRFIKEGGALS